MLYLDTSLVVAAFVPEATSDRVESWLDARAVEEFAISDWVMAEFSAALSVKTRTGQISADRRASALALFASACAGSFTVLPVSRQQFRAAARLADHAALGLRAGDALHLAIGAENSATLCTLDRRLGEAAAALGVAAELV